MAQFREKNSLQSIWQDNLPILWVVISLILSILIAVSFRLLFSPAKMNQLLTSFEEMNPKIKIKTKDIRVSLTSGLIPEFALVFQDGTIQMDQGCNGMFLIDFEHLKIPIRLDSVLHQKLRLGNLQADRLKVVKNKPLSEGCLAAQSQEIKKSAAVTLNTTFEPLSEKSNLLIPGSQDGTAVFKNIPMTGVLIKSLKINIQEGKEGGVEITDLNLKKISDSEVIGEAEFKVDAELTYGETLPELKLSLQLKEEILQAEIHGKIREGQMLLSFEQNLKSSKKTAKLHLKQLPLSPLERLLKNAKVVPEHWKPKSMWVSGDIQSSLESGQEMVLENFQLEGEIGSLIFSTFKYSLKQKTLTPFDVKLDKVSVKEIFQLVQAPPPSGVFSELGFLKGRCSVKAQEDVECLFDVTGLQIVFRKLGRSYTQDLNYALLKGKYQGQKLYLQISKMALGGGALEGYADYTYNLTNYDSLLRYQFEKIKFHPDIETQWFGGKLSEMTANGMVHSKGSDILNASGVLALKSLQSDNYDLLGVKLINAWSMGEWKIDLEAKEVILQKENFLYPAALSISQTNDLEKIYLSSNHAKIFLSKYGLEWRSTFFKIGNSLFTTDGRYDEGQLAGMVKRVGGGKQSQWSLSGNKSQLTLKALDRNI